MSEKKELTGDAKLAFDMACEVAFEAGGDYRKVDIHMMRPVAERYVASARQAGYDAAKEQAAKLATGRSCGLALVSDVLCLNIAWDIRAMQPGPREGGE